MCSPGGVKRRGNIFYIFATVAVSPRHVGYIDPFHKRPFLSALADYYLLVLSLSAWRLRLGATVVLLGYLLVGRRSTSRLAERAYNCLKLPPITASGEECSERACRGA